MGVRPRSTRGRPLAIGVDVGGTKVLAAAVDGQGRATHAVQARTPAARGPDAVLDAAVEAVEACRAKAGGTLACVGVGFAGQVSAGRGRVLASPNLTGWHDVPLARRLRLRLGVRVALANDVQAAAWGEARFGHGRGARDLVFLALGTGVGAGVVANGALLQGAHGSAGELGHVPVVAGGRPCRCGGRGCLEAYVGGWALAREARRAVRERPRAGRRLVALAGSIGRIDARVLAGACQAGDPLARRIAAAAEAVLGQACVGVANAFDPEVIVLGGSVARGFPGFAAAARRRIRLAGLEPVRRLRVVQSALGAAAVAIGAADLARPGPRGRVRRLQG